MSLPSIITPLLELLNVLRAWALLEGIEHADYYLTLTALLLLFLLLVQISALTKPPPVPRKCLPKRPVLQVLFKPDDDPKLHDLQEQQGLLQQRTTTSSVSSPISSSRQHDSSSTPAYVGPPAEVVKDGHILHNQDDDAPLFDAVHSPGGEPSQHTANHQANVQQTNTNNNNDLLPDSFAPLLSSSQTEVLLNQLTPDLLHGLELRATANIRQGSHVIPIIKRPPSSSRNATMITIPRPQLTIHSSMSVSNYDTRRSSDTTPASMSTPTRSGGSRSPMNDSLSKNGKINKSSPTSSSSVPSAEPIKVGGSTISCRVHIGSGGKSFTLSDDLDVTKKTKDRSWTMVKHAEVNISPPLALSNVVPTLLHLPNLFEDTSKKWIFKLLQLEPLDEEQEQHANESQPYYSTVTDDGTKSKFSMLFEQIQKTVHKFIVLLVGFMINFSSVIEAFLWWIESKCHIHLSSVKVEPIFRHTRGSRKSSSVTKTNGGGNENQNDATTCEQRSSKCWRLRVSFSGHVVVCGWLPIPFINVVLPTFIIPAPHAFLKYLCSPQPLASATLRHENLPHEEILMSLMDVCQSWNIDLSAVATPPAFSVDVTLPGGMTVAVETMLGKDMLGGANSTGTTNAAGGVTEGAGGRRSMHEKNGEPQVNLRSSSYDKAADIQTISSLGDGDRTAIYSTGGDRSALMLPETNFERAMSSGATQKQLDMTAKAFDANKLTPWSLQASVHGTIDQDRLAVNISHVSASHSSSSNGNNETSNNGGCQVSCSGNFSIQRADPELLLANAALYYPELDVGDQSSGPLSRIASAIGISNNLLNSSEQRKKKRTTLNYIDHPSVGAILLFPELCAASSKSERLKQLLQYEYSFDIADPTNLDAVSISLGVTHPMLKGATMMTTVLESICLFGTVASNHQTSQEQGRRSNTKHQVEDTTISSIMNPFAPTRKRNMLRHIPATDVTFQINKAFIPEQAMNYIDDGNSIILPEMKGGKMTIRALGGFLANRRDTSERTVMRGQQQQQKRHNSSMSSSPSVGQIKLIADFGIDHFAMKNETKVNEFPELEVYEGDKLVSSTSGTCHGRIIVDLRPLNNSYSYYHTNSINEEDSEKIEDSSDLSNGHNSLGRNNHPKNFESVQSSYISAQQEYHKISLLDQYNLLDSYEIGFSGSYISLKLKEMVATLGHRRIIIPSESTIKVQVIESIVNMAFEGKTQCEFSWDFQGLSPILQVTRVGMDPGDASHEEKRQCPIIIAPLRQGRLTFNVSSVGAISVTQAATSRESREGLYDWKFINALISPNTDADSPKRLIDVLHDKRTMKKLLQVVDLLNNDLYKVTHYILTQVWRAQDIFDQEGITDAAHVIPGHKMARLLSLFLCGDLKLVNTVSPIIKRVISGGGLDSVKVKEILHDNVKAYDEWAPEIDRVLRIASVMLSPMMSYEPPVVEHNVVPLCEVPEYQSKFVGIPSAKKLYETLEERIHLPLDPSFSNLLGRLGPYMTFAQVEYILKVRPNQRDWHPEDLRRLRYVYAVKRKALEIAESYGGISFMPQSFFVSVFLGEATRASLRARKRTTTSTTGSNVVQSAHQDDEWNINDVDASYLPAQNNGATGNKKESMFTDLRRKKHILSNNNSYTRATSTMVGVREGNHANSLSVVLSPAGRIAPAGRGNFQSSNKNHSRTSSWQQGALTPGLSDYDKYFDDVPLMVGSEPYELGDSLLGPQDVAVLLHAGLSSSMKGSTVVQLNQRMLLDLIASQPRTFAVAVLAEIGTPGGFGSTRSLTSALIAILDLDQSSFLLEHRLDMQKLLEEWLPGLKVPRRTDYLAGGRWARQSYYEAMYGLAKNILEDAELYMALKGHIQRVRQCYETDPIPESKEEDLYKRMDEVTENVDDITEIKFLHLVEDAKRAIEDADKEGNKAIVDLKAEKLDTKSDKCQHVIDLYMKTFDICKEVIKSDKLAIKNTWLKQYFRRNYDALMIKTVYQNAIDNVEEVRSWLSVLLRHSNNKLHRTSHKSIDNSDNAKEENVTSVVDAETFFDNLNKHHEQKIIDVIIDCLFFDESERKLLHNDPLVRLLIDNPPGHYNFTIVSAMGVITEGKKGLELESTFQKMKKERGVETIRADTGTARSFEFNASKIEEAIKVAYNHGKPFGLLGYSQGCANCLTTESNFVSGTPAQQDLIRSNSVGLVCRQLLFSAANGSFHGPATEAKLHKLIVMSEDIFKYQQGYFSRAFVSLVLEGINGIMDSSQFHKLIGGAQTFLAEGQRAFWREAQHLQHVPTTVLRGVEENHTTPEALEMLSNFLSKQSGSSLHDSQVHVYDAVGHPVYTRNRNATILQSCDMGGSIQRTHHWSPLNKEVEFLRTKKDMEHSVFDCDKDRHVFPWVDVNARFGIISYVESEETEG